jgi:predicted dinucleotide-binding enzyme
MSVTIAVIGLGGMGSRIARRLLDTGHEVVVWNRSAERAVPLAASGAIPVASPAEAATRADVLITMVADPLALARKDADLIAEVRADLRLAAAARSWLPRPAGGDRTRGAASRRRSAPGRAGGGRGA